MTGGLHGRDVTGNAFCEWLLPIHLDATAEPDRRRAATCQAGTGRTTGHLLAHPDSDAKKAALTLLTQRAAARRDRHPAYSTTIAQCWAAHPEGLAEPASS